VDRGAMVKQKVHSPLQYNDGVLRAAYPERRPFTRRGHYFPRLRKLRFSQNRGDRQQNENPRASTLPGTPPMAGHCDRYCHSSLTHLHRSRYKVMSKCSRRRRGMLADQNTFAKHHSCPPERLSNTVHQHPLRNILPSFTNVQT